MSNYTDILADRMHPGQALGGLILLAVATNLHPNRRRQLWTREPGLTFDWRWYRLRAQCWCRLIGSPPHASQLGLFILAADELHDMVGQLRRLG